MGAVVSACAMVSTVEQPIHLEVEKIPESVYEHKVVPSPKPPPIRVQRTYQARRTSPDRGEDCSSIRTGNIGSDINSKLDCLIRAVEKNQQKGS